MILIKSLILNNFQFVNLNFYYDHNSIDNSFNLINLDNPNPNYLVLIFQISFALINYFYLFLSLFLN